MANERDTSPTVQEKEAPKPRPWWKRVWRVWQKVWKWTAFGEKSLWEWLELFVVSLALAILGVWFTNQQEERQRSVEARRADAEVALEEQRAENAALQAYLDQMSLLMLEEDLRSAESGSDAHMLARARTLTVLSQLETSPDEEESGKEQVVEFLIEAELVHPKNGVDPAISLEETDLVGVDLDGEDLHGVNLRNAVMRGANLAGANLEDANLELAKLRYANLRGANLFGAEIKGAWWEGAKLEGAIMPDGQRIKSETYPNSPTFEEWRKSKGSGEDGENSGPQ